VIDKMNIARINPQAHGSIIVAFHPVSIRVSFIYIFPWEGRLRFNVMMIAHNVCMDSH